MDNFIFSEDYDASIHREILDSLLRHEGPAEDSAIVEICEDRAIAELRGHLCRWYDCDAIFSATGRDRHPLVLMMAVDIAVYHIFCQHNPYKIPDIRRERYERAVHWMEAVASGKVSIDGAPRLPEGELRANSPWQIGSNPLAGTHM